MSEKIYGKISVQIRGLTPLLMNRLTSDMLKEGPTGPGKQYVPEEEARKAAYITKVDGKEQLYVPARWIYACMVKAAAMYKPKGKRYSMSSILAGAMRIEPEEILMGHCNYEIDERPVVISGARVLAWRPKMKEWSLDFSIVYNRVHIGGAAIPQLREILADGGVRLGIGDFRPQHRGWFGTFEVARFEIES